MVAIVHGTSLTHPLESLQQAPWFRALKAKAIQAAQAFWRECQVTGERRARNHLSWLANCHADSNPELARTLRDAMR